MTATDTLPVSVASYCVNMYFVGCLLSFSSLVNKQSKEKENSNCHPPFQFFLSITSKIGFHHLLPGLVSKCNVWFHCIIIFMTCI